jgi:hypothetical protein
MVDCGYAGPVLAVVVFVHGDMVDVQDPDGEVDCFPIEWCWVRAVPGAGEGS